MYICIYIYMYIYVCMCVCIQYMLFQYFRICFIEHFTSSDNRSYSQEQMHLRIIGPIPSKRYTHKTNAKHNPERLV